MVLFCLRIVLFALSCLMLFLLLSCLVLSQVQMGRTPLLSCSKLSVSDSSRLTVSDSSKSLLEKEVEKEVEKV